MALAEPTTVASGAQTQNESKRSNILLTLGDDIGQSNLNAYTYDLIGYQAPDIERTGREGMVFVDDSPEQSCTAGRFSVMAG